jgi:multidrug efflux pump
MHALIDAALGRSRMMLAALALILVWGMVAYVTIPKEANPDVNIPIIYVLMTHEGISPEDGERLLVRPMEQELRTVEGVKEMRSTAREGSASVLLEFEAGFDADKALQDVRERVDLAKPDLPEDADEPTVHEVNVSLFPVIVVTLAGDVPERTLLHIAQGLQEELQGLPGVLSADIAGEREELLEVTIDPARLEALGVTQGELLNAVASNNRLVAAGALDTGQGRFAVKVPGLFETAQDVLSLPLKASGDGVVTLGDVATVRRTFKDPTSFARVNGKPALALEIKKRIGENVIKTIEDVRRIVEARRAAWPETLEVNYIQDESRNIRTMLADLANNAASAIVLVMIVTVAALGLRSSLIVGVAVPASFLFGMIVLQAMGLTVNIVVLFSLILAVGMLVDGATIVVEYADRKMAEGVHRREAYAQAAKRMAWPVISSIATTLAAFLPLLFWPGVVGEFMKYLPLTLIITMGGSLLVALLFVPTLGALFGKPGVVDAKEAEALAAAEKGDIAKLRGFTGLYARTLARVARHPVKVVLAAFALLVGVQTYYWSHGNGVEFFPNVEPERGLIHVHARGNMSVREEDALVREVERRAMQVPGVRTVYTRTGGVQQGEEAAEDVVGTIFLEFTDWRTRRKADEVLEEVRRRTADLAGVQVETREPDAGPPTGKAVQLELRSRLPDELEPAVAKVRAHMEQMAGLIDIEDSRPLPGIQWELQVDRAQAARFGADVSTIGAVVQLVTNGVKVGEYRPDDADEEIDIRVRYPLDERGMLQLDRLRVQTRQGLAPISNFVTREAAPQTGTLKRTDGERAIKLQANVAPGVLADDKVSELRQWLTTAELDPAVTPRFKGADRDQQEAQSFLQRAFLVAIFLIAIILVAQFNSFYYVFLILTAVVMSTVGVFMGLIVTGQTFGIVMTGIGVISLAGIVVGNNIVLIDTYAILRREGVPPLDAVIRTGAQRLRPVFLTTITTILGLLPMCFMVNIDLVAREVTVGAPSTQWWVQLSTAVVFGLTFATMLTLVVTPCLLMLRENFRAWRERRRASAAPEAANAPAERLGEAAE